ncbi:MULTISPECIES: YaaL family protein [Oceanobacillus]|uniref:DUF2508 family protein n=1 Tax=Oceanobacillus kimchii TaxID=746691 RepID=A0ABQ5TDV0_9BACI|nr:MULTISPECIES: YaaL family protein [Oceanobacillus]MBT2599867.1 YaaL family protein [Oceanobacillus sp. ISL-74]MBT2652683.1 YaaL family protein [Oceanobacillus sp. ISL-73]MCT1577226.1 YaaL family protein [Oceanobacillus kimchii]MCT2135296.1 YaaL family protein [Oceanobacillus kimchii]OEH56561.1 hypothetical protein AQ616_03320 [Oceanobacillus sp. E9]
MGKKLRKRDVDQELLNSLYHVDHEWKQLQNIVRQSIEPTQSGQHEEKLAKAKYMFLIREARIRKVSAVRV